MKKLSKSILWLLPIILFSCGEKAQEVKNVYEAVSNLDEMAESIEQETTAAEKKRQERIAKGDTLAMPYADLQKYLPKEISGYSLDGEPEGSTMNMPGMSYSQCEQSFVKGDDRITVAIYDYNGAYDMYTGATALFSTGMSFENDQEKAQGVSLKGDKFKGWETFKKTDKNASLLLGVGHRFYLSINAEKQENTDFVKSIAENMNLEELASK